MNVKLLESARPFFDSNEQVNGVDCRKATFILVTNTGFDGLVDMAYQYDQKVILITLTSAGFITTSVFTCVPKL